MIQPKCTSAFPYWDITLPKATQMHLPGRIKHCSGEFGFNRQRTPTTVPQSNGSTQILTEWCCREICTGKAVKPTHLKWPDSQPSLPWCQLGGNSQAWVLTSHQLPQALGKVPSLSTTSTRVLAWCEKTIHKCMCVYTQIHTCAHMGRNVYMQQVRKTPPQPQKGDQEPHT